MDLRSKIKIFKDYTEIDIDAYIISIEQLISNVKDWISHISKHYPTETEWLTWNNTLNCFTKQEV